ncbi:YraN family protein [Cytophagales bacterium RKSG123]|nr:YraN family protein [Xanthovirga aplysinae]
MVGWILFLYSNFPIKYSILAQTKAQTVGKKGEKLAERLLEAKGFEIQEKNYRFERNEIDLIAKKGNLLLFVEVKCRSDNYFGEAETFLGKAQTQRILVAAENYIFSTNWEGDIRFDVIAIQLKNKMEIVHFEDAFY